MRDLGPGFNGFDKDNCKAKGKHFKFVDMVRIISDVWQYVCWIANSFFMGTVKAGKLHTVFHKNTDICLQRNVHHRNVPRGIRVSVWILINYYANNVVHNDTHGMECIPLSASLTLSGPRFNIKMSSYQYRKSHCGDKTVVRSSYLHNGISYTGKMSSLYWIRALKGSHWLSVISVKNAKMWNFDVFVFVCLISQVKL